MNPLKSLMVGAVLALTLASAAHAADEYRRIQAEGQTYYVLSAEFDKLKADGTTPIFARPDQSTRKAGYTLKKKADGTYVLLLNGVEKKATVLSVQTSTTKVPGVGGQTPQPKPQPQGRQASGKPAGVDSDVWSIINSHPDFKKLNRASRQAAAKRMQEYKKKNAELYGKIKDAPADAKNKAVHEIVMAKATEDPKAVQERVNVALGFKPDGTPNVVNADPVSIGGGQTGGGDQELKEDENEIVVLNKLITTMPAVKEDVDKRLARWLAAKKGQDSFIDPAYVDSAEGKEAKVGERLPAVSKSWSDKKIADGKVAQVSKLIFIIGFDDNAVPAWGKKYKSLELMADPEREKKQDYPGKMSEGMKGWTAGVKKTSADAAGRLSPGAYAGAPIKIEEWTFAILEFAAEKANSIYTDRRQKEKTVADINGNNQGDGTPAYGSTGAGGQLDSVKGWDHKDMFENGAVAGNLVINGAGGYRRISLKIFTRREVPSGKLVNELGIFDISNPGDANTPGRIYGQRFSLGQRGEQVFRLDDRAADSFKYKLSMSADGKITFGTPDGRSKIETSHKELLEKREDQARKSAVTRIIDGRTYRLVPQGGKYAGILYYETDDSGRIKSPRTPSNVAFVSQVGPDGQPENLAPPQTAIGYVGPATSDKSNFYYLKWSEEKKLFEPTKCAKDSADMPCEFKAPPKPAPTTVAATDGNTGGNTGNNTGNNTGGNTTDGNNTTTDAPVNNSESLGEVAGSDESIMDCQIKKDAFGTQLMYHEEKIQGRDKNWKFFLTTKPPQNGFQLCLNGSAQQTVFYGGIPVWGKTRLDPKNLITETILVERGPVPALEVKCGQVKGPKFEIKARGEDCVFPTVPEPYTITSRFIHYIEKSAVSREAITATANQNVYASKVAWASLVVDPAKPNEVRTIELGLKNLDKADALSRIDRAFAIGDLKKTGLGDANAVSKIKDFVGKHLHQHGSEVRMVSDPKISIQVFFPKEVADPNQQPLEVVNINAAADAQQVPKQYEALIYCYHSNNQGKPRGLETRSEHYQHAKGS